VTEGKVVLAAVAAVPMVVVPREVIGGVLGDAVVKEAWHDESLVAILVDQAQVGQVENLQ
jgi:hypothetical protein